MLTQIQKMLRASPTAIIVEVSIPDACIVDGNATLPKLVVDLPRGQLHWEELLLAT